MVWGSSILAIITRIVFASVVTLMVVKLKAVVMTMFVRTSRVTQAWFIRGVPFVVLRYRLTLERLHTDPGPLSARQTALLVPMCVLRSRLLARVVMMLIPLRDLRLPTAFGLLGVIDVVHRCRLVSLNWGSFYRVAIFPLAVRKITALLVVTGLLGLSTVTLW